MEDERTEKGRFKPGHKGGPGRGNKKDRYPWADDPVAYRKNVAPRVLRVIAGMIDSSDQKIQREGAKLYIQLFGMETEARSGFLDPKLLDGFGAWFFEQLDEEESEKSPSSGDEGAEGADDSQFCQPRPKGVGGAENFGTPTRGPM